MAIDRADLLRASTTLTGIDFVQVSANQTLLTLFLVHDTLPPALAATLAGLDASHFTIEGEGAVDPPQVPVRVHMVPLPAPVDGRAVLRLTLQHAGGFGWYRLHVNSPAIDPFFNGVRFSFKAACPSELDCAPPPHACAGEAPVDFPVDYRARDFGSFRQVLIDFASQRYPDWQDRLEADVGMLVLEMLAALGDEFAYAQDRLAREACLPTATQRRSLRHLARLVNYPLDDGSGAFTWIDVQALAAGTLAAGTLVSDAQQQIFFEIGKGLRDTPIGLPAVQYTVSPGANQMQPHLWDEAATCLPAGSTELTLQGAHAAELLPRLEVDAIGRWALLRTQPSSPDVPERRLAIRIVECSDDADPLLGVPITRIRWDVPTPWEIDLETLLLRANLLPATAGRTQSLRFRIGPLPPPGDPEPELPAAIERIGTGSSLCYPAAGSAADEASKVKFLFSLPGSDETPLVWLPVATAEGIRQQPEVALARDAEGPWAWREALVGETTALPTDSVFTLEDGMWRRVVGLRRPEHPDGDLVFEDFASGSGSTLRFGDGEFGRVPSEHSKFTVAYRLGNGSRTNVAPDTLTLFPGGVPAVVDTAVGIGNPLAGAGGREPETAEQVRIHAPQAWRATTYRAVQPADHAAIAERLDEVQRAGAAVRWTGSWPTVFVTPDPRDTFGLTPELRTTLEALMDRVRQAGREVKVMAPRYADIDLEIHLCVAPNAYRGEVKQAALEALFGAPAALAAVGGSTLGIDSGFFDPNRFTFGTPLSRAALIAALQAVPGVRAVEGMRVRRRGWFDWRDFTEFSLPVGVDELIRVANDRNQPERGAVRLVMEGGA